MNDVTELRSLVNFLASQDLGYPRYDSWVQKTEHELGTGTKHAILAEDHGRLVGDVVFQRHKNIADAVEIKNARVVEKFKWRHFGSFMLAQVEAECDVGTFICDVRSNRTDIINFLCGCGYRPLLKSHLYDENDIPDVTMVKRKHKRSLLEIKKAVEAMSL